MDQRKNHSKDGQERFPLKERRSKSTHARATVRDTLPCHSVPPMFPTTRELAETKLSCSNPFEGTQSSTTPRIPSVYRPRSHVDFDARAHASGLLLQSSDVRHCAGRVQKNRSAHGDRNATETSPGFEASILHLYAEGSPTGRVITTQAKYILFGTLVPIHDRQKGAVANPKRHVACQCHCMTME